MASGRISVPGQRLKWGETLQPGAHLSPASIYLHLNTKLFYLSLRRKLFPAYLLAEKQSGNTKSDFFFWQQLAGAKFWPSSLDSL